MFNAMWFAVLLLVQGPTDLVQLEQQVEAEKDLAGAKAALTAMVAEAGDGSDAMALLLKVFQKTDDFETGLDYSERAVKAAPKDPRMHFYHAMLISARCQKAQMRWMIDKGTYLSHLETAIELDPNYLPPYFGLIGWHAKAPGFIGASKKTAHEWADRLTALDKVNGGLQKAMVYKEDKQLDKAEAVYQALHASGEEGARVALEYGVFLYGRKEYRRAYDVFKNHHDDYMVVYQSAKARIQGGFEVESAIVDLDRFIEADHQLERPSKAGAWWRKGQGLEALKRHKDALAAYRQAVSMDPEFEEAKADLKRLEKSL